MGVWEVILGIATILVSLFIIIVILLQQGHRAGITGAISDGADTFLSKNIYASVSHITTQNEFYLYGLSRLHIRENISSINLGTDAIVEMLNVQENAREADADHKANLLFGSLSILVVFSALTDMAALFDVAGAWQSAKMPFYYIFRLS